MQLPTTVWALLKRRHCVASRSMFGVVSRSLQPNTPTESQLISSVVMMSTLRGFAPAAEAWPANKKRTASKTAFIGKFTVNEADGPALQNARFLAFRMRG